MNLAKVSLTVSLITESGALLKTMVPSPIIDISIVPICTFARFKFVRCRDVFVTSVLHFKEEVLKVIWNIESTDCRVLEPNAKTIDILSSIAVCWNPSD